MEHANDHCRTLGSDLPVMPSLAIQCPTPAACIAAEQAAIVKLLYYTQEVEPAITCTACSHKPTLARTQHDTPSQSCPRAFVEALIPMTQPVARIMVSETSNYYVDVYAYDRSYA